MKKFKSYISIGVFVVLLLISLLIYFISSESELSPKQTYSVEIYHCGPIANNIDELNVEMSEFLKCSPIPGSSGFIAPVVNLHDMLVGDEVTRISVPLSGLTCLGELFSSDYNDYNNRKEDEADMIGEGGDFFSREEYKIFSVSALVHGDSAVNQVRYDLSNNTTEFFIDRSQAEINSSDNKVWKSLAALKKHINSLIAENKILSGSVIKIYYQCRRGVPPSDTDLDGDGVMNNEDLCPEILGDTACGGCICETPPIEEPRVEEPVPPVIEFPEAVEVVEAPHDFVLNNGTLSWSGGPNNLRFRVVTSYGAVAGLAIDNGGQLKLNNGDYTKLQKTIKNKRLEFEDLDGNWNDCRIPDFSCSKVIKDE
jgi:hypothetical protein